MPTTVTISIARYNPETDQHPSFQTYEVPCGEQELVLGALFYIYEHIDSTLLFSHGCRYRNCGKCAIRINGRPALACETPLEDHMILEPLDNLPVIRDLAVDRSGLFEPLKQHKTLFQPVSANEKVTQPPEFFQLLRCNECLACLSSCPVFARDLEYDGPFIGIKLAALKYDIREARNGLEPLAAFLEKCIHCKQCQVNCPWELRFPETATRIKGELFRLAPLSVRDWLLSRPRLIGALAACFKTPANALIANAGFRKILDQLLGIDRRVPLPRYAKSDTTVMKATRPSGLRAAYFLGCFDKYNAPEIVTSSLSLLSENGVDVEVIDPGCCGEPFIATGDLASARQRAMEVAATLETWIGKGYDIVFSCPSCGTMIRDEYPSLFQVLIDPDIRQHIFDLGEYLFKHNSAGRIGLKFKPERKRIAYKVPCHLKAQKIGTPFVDLLKFVPDLDISIFDTCCGMAGTLGFRKESIEFSREVGKPLADAIRNEAPEIVLSDCAACRLRIEAETNITTCHPILFLDRRKERI